MINIENLEQANKFKEEDFSVLLIWAEGCGFCEEAKPMFQALEDKFTDFNFYQWKLDRDSFEFYSQYEEKEPVRIPSLDEDGDPILDARGNQISQLATNENGEVVKRAPISVPKLYVFHGEESTEENPYGLLGKVDGFNMGQLEAILGQIKDMQEQEDGEA